MVRIKVAPAELGRDVRQLGHGHPLGARHLVRVRVRVRVRIRVRVRVRVRVSGHPLGARHLPCPMLAVAGCPGRDVDESLDDAPRRVAVRHRGRAQQLRVAVVARVEDGKEAW